MTQPTLKEMLARTSRVTLQLSNLCPYSRLHKGKCPAQDNVERDGRQIMPAMVVMDVLHSLEETESCERPMEVAFHVYNEPLVDPRLAMFLDECRQSLWWVVPVVCTNGWYLDEGLALELVGYGMRKLVCSPYWPEEKGRMAAIGKAVQAAGCKYHQTWGTLDSRMQYRDNPGQDTRHWCSAPFKDLIIRASGRLGLCCLDCREEIVWASVADLGFERALRESWPEMHRINEELCGCVRSMEICKHCIKGRR